MKHLILALALILPLSVGAFKPEDLEELKKTNECRECDLSGANLKGAYLMGTYLAGAKLWKANLVGAILCNTTMPDGRIEYSGCAVTRIEDALKRIEELLERK